MTNNLILYNNIEEITKIEAFVEKIGESANLSLPIIMNVNLVLEEVIANIIMYAFPKSEIHEIHLSSSYNEETNALSLVITDDGSPFDPTKTKDPCIDKSLEEREIGGLGIFIIKKIMDQVSYQRINNMNVLTLKKNLSTK